MKHEIAIAGILFAPFAVYCAAALPIFLAVRYGLARVGIMRLVWHPTLFETALYISIVSLITILT